jgi:hypothetical protein
MRGGRNRNPRGQGARLREELIEATTRLSTVERETRSACGPSPEAGAYLHFTGVEELLWEVYCREYGELADWLRRAAGVVDGSRQRLSAVCDTYWQFALERPAPTS